MCGISYNPVIGERRVGGGGGKRDDGALVKIEI